MLNNIFIVRACSSDGLRCRTRLFRDVASEALPPLRVVGNYGAGIRRAGGCGGRKARAVVPVGRLFRAVVRADGWAGMPCGGGGFAGSTVSGGCGGPLRRVAVLCGRSGRLWRAKGPDGEGPGGGCGGRLSYAVAAGCCDWRKARKGKARAVVRAYALCRMCAVGARPPRPRLPANRMSAAEKRSRNLSLPARKRIFEGH